MEAYISNKPTGSLKTLPQSLKTNLNLEPDTALITLIPELRYTLPSSEEGANVKAAFLGLRFWDYPKGPGINA